MEIEEFILQKYEIDLKSLESGELISSDLCTFGTLNWVNSAIEGSYYEKIIAYVDSFPSELRGECKKYLNIVNVENNEESIDKEKRRYHRCYKVFMQKRVPSGDIRLTKIISGEISGTDACMELLSFGDLIADRLNFGWSLAPENKELGKQVLKTFNDLHRSWFSNILFPEPSVTYNTERFT